jgi:hypothetical protein
MRFRSQPGPGRTLFGVFLFPTEFPLSATVPRSVALPPLLSLGLSRSRSLGLSRSRSLSLSRSRSHSLSRSRSLSSRPPWPLLPRPWAVWLSGDRREPIFRKFVSPPSLCIEILTFFRAHHCRPPPPLASSTTNLHHHDLHHHRPPSPPTPPPTYPTTISSRGSDARATFESWLACHRPHPGLRGIVASPFFIAS